jgi:hypothetical protein
MGRNCALSRPSIRPDVDSAGDEYWLAKNGRDLRQVGDRCRPVNTVRIEALTSRGPLTTMQIALKAGGQLAADGPLGASAEVKLTNGT